MCYYIVYLKKRGDEVLQEGIVLSRVLLPLANREAQVADGRLVVVRQVGGAVHHPSDAQSGQKIFFSDF